MGISPPLAGIMLYKYCISHLLTAKKNTLPLSFPRYQVGRYHFIIKNTGKK